MTRERDIERVLDAWLLDGPAEMPDRLFDSVLDRVERQPQRRLARFQLRYREMQPITRLAAAAAIVIVALGAGYVALGRTAPSVGTASPVPTSPASAAPAPTPSATASSAVLPPELAHLWIGAPRSFAAGGGSPTAPAVRVLHLSDGAYLSVGAGGREMASTVSVPADDTIRLTGGNISAAPCGPGDTGDYRWSLSADGVTLTLTPVSDACAARGEAIAGTWTRSACLDQNEACLGALPAGTYVSSFFDPYRGPGERPSYGDYGRLRYTLPDGWANGSDFPMGYSIVPTPDYALPPASGQPLFHGIYLQSRASASAQDASCTNAGLAGVPQTLAGLTSWLVSHPGLTATAPTSLTIGGHPARMTDIQVARDWTTTCPDSNGQPVVVLFREADPDATGWSWGIGGSGERQRIILVDLGGGDILLIALDDTSSPSRFDALVQQAMPVVQSFEFP